MCMFLAVRNSHSARGCRGSAVLLLGAIVHLFRVPAWVVGALSACLCLFSLATIAGATGSPSVMSPESVRDLTDQAARDAARRERALGAPAAVAARRASADAFSDQTAVQAKTTLTTAFEAVALAPAYATDDLVEDGKITRLLGEKSAQVALDGGDKGVLLSGLPLQVRADDGSKQKVDAALVSEGSDLVPIAPLADYTVAKDVSEGIDLEAADVNVAPIGPGAGDARVQRVGDSVLWANVLADTDFMVTPLADGVETFHQIRSEDAPESFSLDVTVPEGGEIVRSPELPQALEIKDAGGDVVTRVSPVIAQDADGTNVPASYVIDDERHRITIQVPHRDRDVHYPILVDPSFHVWELHEDPASGGEYPGWTYEGHPWVEHRAGLGYWGWGIYAWLQANQAFTFADMGRWLFRAPGDSTIAAATMRATYFTAAAHSCLFEGIANAPMTAFDDGMTALTNGTDLTTNPYITCGAGYNASFANQSRGISSTTKGPGNAALFAITAWAPPTDPWVYPSPNVDLAYLAASDVVIEDGGEPTVTSTVSGSTVTFNLNDTGTGIKWAQATKTGGWVDNNTFNCAYGEGYPHYGCTKSRTVTVPNVQPGDHVSIAVTDEAGNGKISSVDIPPPGPPTVALSGRAKSLDGKAVFADAYPLHVVASGYPERIEVSVDGTVVHTQSKTCTPSPCTLSTDYSFVGANNEPGDHTISVVAKDHAGSASAAQSIHLSVATDDPLPTEADLVSDSVRFRQDFGLNSSTSHIQAVLNQPDEAARSEFGVPLTGSELTTMRSVMGADDETAVTSVAAYAAAQSDYAGQYSSPTTNTLHVQFTTDIDGHQQAIDGLDNGDTSVVVEEAERTVDQLAAIRDLLADDPDVTSVGIDYEANKVVVTTASGALPSGISVPAGSVTVSADTVEATADSKRTLTYDPVIPGVRMFVDGGSRCTTGFVFQAGDPDGSAFPQRYSGVLTAGHCVDHVDEQWQQGSRKLGEARQKYFQNGGRSDAAAIQTSNYPVRWRGVSDKVYISSAARQTITKVQSQNKDRVNNPICMSGQVSGVKCGKLVVVSMDSVKYGGKNLKSLRLASFHCQQGDSGAPVYRGGMAIGLVAARSTHTGRCYYSHIGHVQEDLGLYIKHDE